MTQAHFSLKVIYCDNHVLAVDKPAGVLSQGDSTGDKSILDYAKSWLKREYNKPGNVYLGLVHRLDRPVSGVMVFGRTSKGASRLSESFRTRVSEKSYVAVVQGAVSGAGVLHDVLDGKECSLGYEALRTIGRDSLLLLHPRTGRKHQIRRQLSLLGHPILGDIRYGASGKLPGRRIALHAHRLVVPHPTTKAPLDLCSGVPPFLEPTLWENLNLQTDSSFTH